MLLYSMSCSHKYTTLVYAVGEYLFNNLSNASSTASINLGTNTPYITIPYPAPRTHAAGPRNAKTQF